MIGLKYPMRNLAVQAITPCTLDVALREDEEPELAPRERRPLAHAEAQMVQAVADPTTATKRHARALLLGG